MSWQKDLRKIAKKVGEDLGALSQNIKIDLFNSVIEMTIVKDGYLKANWNIQENEKDTRTDSEADKEGVLIKAQVDARATSDGVTFFTNSMPYAAKIEEQVGMVKNSIIITKSNVSRLAAKL